MGRSKDAKKRRRQKDNENKKIQNYEAERTKWSPQKKLRHTEQQPGMSNEEEQPDMEQPDKEQQQVTCETIKLTRQHKDDSTFMKQCCTHFANDKILQKPGTATFTFPVASIGINGGYKCHRDQRDVIKTVWICACQGALVFPAFEHTVHVSRGDIIVFDGNKHYHANTVRRDKMDVRNLVVSQGKMTIEQYLHEAAGLQIPQFNQLIICLYFQKQQRSYLMNAYEAHCAGT